MAFTSSTTLNPLNVDLTNVNHVEQIINETEDWQNMERKRRAWRDYQILEGNQKFYVRDELMNKFPDSWSNFRIGDIGVTNKVIKKKAKAYKNDPMRELANKSETKAYQTILKEGKFKRAFKEADKIYNYFKYCLLWVQWLTDEELGLAAGEDTERSGKYFLKALKPYEYDLIRHPSTGEPLIFIMNLPDNDVTGSVGTNDGDEETITEDQADVSADSEVYALWSKTQHVKVIKKSILDEDENGNEIIRIEYEIVSVNPDNENPFAPLLPVTFLSKDSSGEYPIENNLSDQSIDFNVGFSNLKTASDAQGHGQLVSKRHPDQKVTKLHMGMHTAIDITLPKTSDVPQPDVEYINANPDLEGQLSTLKFEITMILDENDINVKSTIQGGAQQFASGFDRLLSEADCHDVIEDNQSLYADNTEQGVYQIIKSGEETLGRGTFKSPEVAVKYPKPKVLISDKETLDNISKQEELGVAFSHEKHIVMNPNLSEKEAKKREADIQAEREERTRAEAALQKELFPEPAPMIG